MQQRKPLGPMMLCVCVVELHYVHFEKPWASVTSSMSTEVQDCPQPGIMNILEQLIARLIYMACIGNQKLGTSRPGGVQFALGI